MLYTGHYVKWFGVREAKHPKFCFLETRIQFPSQEAHISHTDTPMSNQVYSQRKLAPESLTDLL